MGNSIGKKNQQNKIDHLIQLMKEKFDIKAFRAFNPNGEAIMFDPIKDNKITFKICDQGGCNYDMVKAMNDNNIKGLKAEVIGSKNMFFSSEIIEIMVELDKLEGIIKSLNALKAEKFDHSILKC